MSGFAGMVLASRVPPAAPSGGDPYWNQVTILLQGNGANNGTVITDSSSLNNTITKFGAVKTSTTQVKFGSASIFMDGTSPYDYLTTPNTNNIFAFGTGDYTIEGWIYPTTFAKASVLAAQWFPGNGAQSLWTIQVGTNGKFTGGLIYSTASFNLTTEASNGTFTLNAWNHWAISITGLVASAYINGTRAGTKTLVGTMGTSTAPLFVGYRESNNNFTGYMDDFRITKGVGRYSGATITVPTAEFPTS
jgi:hypothetical protein